MGIVHTPLTYVFTGNMFLSPGFVTRYSKEIYIAENSVIKLRHPATDIGALRRDASSDVAPGVPVLDFHVTGRRVTATTDVEGAMLRLLAAIIGLAGVAFVGQALARSAATVGTDAPALRAMGMTRREPSPRRCGRISSRQGSLSSRPRSRPSLPRDGSRLASPAESIRTVASGSTSSC